MRKTEFFKQYGHLLVNVFDEQYNDNEYDRNEGGDYLLWEDVIAQDYEANGYIVCTVYEQECDTCDEVVSMEFDLGNNPMKVGYLVLKPSEEIARYSVIIEDKLEGIVVTEDGGVATYYEQDGMFNLCLYQSHIIGFNPNNDAHWDELYDCNMYVQLYSREQLGLYSMNEVEALQLIALMWLCPKRKYYEVPFKKLF